MGSLIKRSRKGVNLTSTESGHGCKKKKTSLILTRHESHVSRRHDFSVENRENKNELKVSLLHQFLEIRLKYQLILSAYQQLLRLVTAQFPLEMVGIKTNGFDKKKPSMFHLVKPKNTFIIFISTR